MKDLVYSLIIPLLSALIGGAFSVWVFRQGLIKSEQRARLDDIKTDFEIEEYVSLNIRSIAYFVNKQVTEIGKTSQLCKNWRSKRTALSILPELKINELREISLDRLFKILVLQKKGQTSIKSSDFINFKNSLHHLERFSELHELLNLEALTKLKKNLDCWNSGLQKLLVIYNELAIEYPYDPKDEFMQLLNYRLVNKQRQLIFEGDDQDMQIFYKEIILPIEIFISSKKSKLDIRTKPIITALIECKKVYKEAQSIKYSRRVELITSGRNLIRVKQTLINSFNNLKNRPNL